MDKKRCRECNKVKPKSEYHANKTRKDGLQSYCKECSQKIVKRRRYEQKTNRKWHSAAPSNFHLYYCPLNSWTDDSRFTRAEVYEMLNLEQLAIGTKFRRNGEEYVVDCFSYGALKLVKV